MSERQEEFADRTDAEVADLLAGAFADLSNDVVELSDRLPWVEGGGALRGSLAGTQMLVDELVARSTKG